MALSHSLKMGLAVLGAKAAKSLITAPAVSANFSGSSLEAGEPKSVDGETTLDFN